MLSGHYGSGECVISVEFSTTYGLQSADTPHEVVGATKHEVVGYHTVLKYVLKRRVVLTRKT